MKHPIGLAALFLTLLIGCEPAQMQSDKYSSFEFHRGTNIAHWLSQSNRRGVARDTFFTRADVAFIDSVGFDHIRMPVDEEQLWDEQGNRHDSAFALLDNFMHWCDEFGLRAIIDMHILRSHYFNAEVKPLFTDPYEQDKFIALWKDLSKELHQWPNGMVAYEIMNEPVADDPEIWNNLVARVVDSIRSWEPERPIVIGSNRWQSAQTFNQLKVPNDKHIILSFHFYEPFYLTHYQASWTNLRDFTGQVNYPGRIVADGDEPDQRRIYNRDTLEWMMRKPLKVADSLKLPLYCGEFGVIFKAPRDSRLAWYRDMVSIFDERGIAYANWNYKAGSFGIVDAEMKSDQELVTILVSP